MKNELPVLIPVSILLWCPRCRFQHIDAAEPGWTNPPHRSHKCKRCSHIWRPADVVTTGVASIVTAGANDGSAAPPDARTDPVMRLSIAFLDRWLDDEIPEVLRHWERIKDFVEGRKL